MYHGIITLTVHWYTSVTLVTLTLALNEAKAKARSLKGKARSLKGKAKAKQPCLHRLPESFH